MEEVILRFPHLSEKMFVHLDNVSLERCREVSKTWKNILDKQKLLHIRRIQSYLKKKHEIGKSWKRVLKKSNKEMIIQLSSAVKKVYSKKKFRKRKQILNPLHVAAICGQEYLYRYLEERVEGKSPKRKQGFTPFHYAAENGH